VILSFSRAYGELAVELGDRLRTANVVATLDPWEGGGGVPATRARSPRIEHASCVIVLLTPSAAAATWLGDEWKEAVYDRARAFRIPVWPVRGADAETPAYLAHVTYADIHNRDRDIEVRSLIEDLRDHTQDSAIVVPDAAPSAIGRGAAPGWRRVPVLMEVSLDLAWLSDGHGGRTPFDVDAGRLVRDGLRHELGVVFPPFTVEATGALRPGSARISFNGIPERSLALHSGQVMVNDSAERLLDAGYDATPTINPANDAPAAWVPLSQGVAAIQSGLVIHDTTRYLMSALSALLRTKAADFIGVEEVRALIERLATVRPNLVAKTVPTVVPWFVLTDVLRRLVAELVSIRDLRRILMTLADWGRIERDPLHLTEYVRAGLRRQLTHQFSRGTKTLLVFLLDPSLEALLREHQRHTLTGTYLDLEPERVAQFVRSARNAIQALGEGVQVPQILTTIEIRSTVRKVLASLLPHVHATSYDELVPDANVQPIGRIGLDGYELRREFSIEQPTLRSPRA
jgi:hypothetical protein